MPIEIRELNIKTFVNDNTLPGATGQSGGGRISSEEKENIISHCVEQVMQRLKDKEER
jgi:hypothetical protein